jgi:L-iditol 2-dehydrogenase
MSNVVTEVSAMKAAVLIKQGKIIVQEREVPSPRHDEVLVQVAAVGVCGSDVHYYDHGRIGTYVVTGSLILGHELSGVIVAVGSTVNSDRVGQRVAVEPQRPCRVCAQCKEGHYNLCPRMEFFATPPIDGALCEYVTIQSDFAHAIPDNVTDEAAALMEPLSVGIWACKRAEVGVGSRVLIAGAGPIGLILAQTARACGASEIFVTDISAERREMALTLGATRVLDPLADSIEDLHVDAFIDASGAPSAVRSGIMAVRPAGRVVLVGLGNESMELPVSIIQDRELWLTGVFRYVNTWPTAIDLVASGKINLDVLVTGRFGLADTEAALKAGKIPGQMKAIIFPRR